MEVTAEIVREGVVAGMSILMVAAFGLPSFFALPPGPDGTRVMPFRSRAAMSSSVVELSIGDSSASFPGSAQVVGLDYRPRTSLRRERSLRQIKSHSSSLELLDVRNCLPTKIPTGHVVWGVEEGEHAGRRGADGVQATLPGREAAAAAVLIQDVLEVGEDLELLVEQVTPLDELSLLGPVEVVDLVQLLPQPIEELPHLLRPRLNQLRLVLVLSVALSPVKKNPRQNGRKLENYQFYYLLKTYFAGPLSVLTLGRYISGDPREHDGTFESFQFCFFLRHPGDGDVTCQKSTAIRLRNHHRRHRHHQRPRNGT